jgi:sugar lactone lactonase YvrE
MSFPGRLSARTLAPRVPAAPALLLLGLLALLAPAVCAGTIAATPCPGLPGDVDQDNGITTADALLVFQWALGMGAPQGCDLARADVDGDGGVTSSDALCVFRDALLLPNGCLPPLLAPRHANTQPLRLARGPTGRIFVSDPGQGAVFVYSSDLVLIGELSGLGRPLGPAVDPAGRIFVGDDLRDRVEVYHLTGVFLFSIGEGTLVMPNDLDLDRQGNLYVADSRANLVRVYDSEGNHLRDIDAPPEEGGLRFPSAVLVAYRQTPQGETAELYVADQGHGRIHVFELSGAHLRSFGQRAEAFSSRWEGKFGMAQSLALDDAGRLHVVDSYFNTVQIFDPVSGDYLGRYGDFGSDTGALNLPLDILPVPDHMLLANTGNRRLERMTPPE